MMDHEPSSDRPARTQSREQTVLIVDDEPDILSTLSDTIQAYVPHVRVLTAPSGHEGLEILERERVDLIMTDYRMTSMDGIEFLAEARKAAPSVPRIMLTAFPDLDLAIQALNEQDVECFLTKPLESAAIVDAVTDVLDQSHTDDQRARSFARSLDLLRRQLGHARP